MSIKDKIIQDAAGKLMGWKLPHDFYPDCYVHFDRATANANGSWPTGTNLFHVGQATDMLEYCIGASLRTALAERDAECDTITEMNHAQWLALENVRTLASRNAKEDWAQHMLRFCASAGSVASPLRTSQRDTELATLRTAAQQALEALQYHTAQTRPIFGTDLAIEALTAALESKT